MGSQSCSWFLLRLSTYLWPYKAVIQLCCTTQRKDLQWITEYSVPAHHLVSNNPAGVSGAASLCYLGTLPRCHARSSAGSGLSQLCCSFWASQGSSAWPVLSCIAAPSVAHPQSLAQNGINQALLKLYGCTSPGSASQEKVRRAKVS